MSTANHHFTTVSSPNAETIAAALVAPTVILADATIYGQSHVTLDWFDSIDWLDIKRDDEKAYQGWTLNRGQIGKGNPRGNRLGVKGSEDLGRGRGLKAIYQIEFNIPLANEEDLTPMNGDLENIKMRNTYLGLKGAFSTFLMGRHDTPFKMSTSKLELFNDTMADYQGTLGFDDHRMDNTIAYVTPSIQGFQFAAALIPGAASTLVGEENLDANGLAEGYSLAATYANGPWYFSVAHEVLSENFDDMLLNPNPADFEKWRVVLGIRDGDGFSVSALYEDQKSINAIEKIDDKNNDAILWQVQVGYAFGNNMVKAMYGQRDHKAEIDEHTNLKSLAVGFDHKLSQRTKTYVLYTHVDTGRSELSLRNFRHKGDWKGISLGIIHSF